MFVLKVDFLLITLKSCCILIKAATVYEKFEPSNETVTFIEGDIAILPCPFKTMGKLKVAWLYSNMNVISFQDQRITDDLRVSLVDPANDTWNLHINNISSKDTGYYKCVLNSNPTQIKRISLHVKTAATVFEKFEPSNETVTFIEGDIAILPCPFKTMGKLKVAWLNSNMNVISFQNQRITDDLRVSLVDPANDTWNLHINNISSKDVGYYKCILNSDPMQIKRIYLHVKTVARGRENIQTMDVPTVYHITAKDGRNAILPCSLKNWPKGNVQVVRISSKKNSKDVLVNSTKDRDGNFHIKNVSYKDTGYYRCRLKNDPENNLIVFLKVKGQRDKIASKRHSVPTLGTYCIRYWRRPTLRRTRPTLRTTEKVDQTTKRTWTLDPKLDLSALRASDQRFKEERKPPLFRCI